MRTARCRVFLRYARILFDDSYCSISSAVAGIKLQLIIHFFGALSTVYSPAIPKKLVSLVRIQNVCLN